MKPVVMNIVLSFFFICSKVLEINSLDVTKRIVGGHIIEDDQIMGNSPYVATLIIDGAFTCAATLITRSHLLTAAHCVDELVLLGEFGRPVIVLVGSTKLYQGIPHSIKRISHHRGFFRGFHENLHEYYPDDIAVIHLTYPVTLSVKVLPIGLPNENEEIPDRTPVIISGFGGDFQSSEPSSHLSKILLTTAPLRQCQRKMRRSQLRNTNLCTMSMTGFGCSIGDDGSPMVDYTESYILGILSDGTYGCNAQKPDVYTKVSRYFEYILSEIYYNEKKGKFQEHPAINYIFKNQRKLYNAYKKL